MRRTLALIATPVLLLAACSSGTTASTSESASSTAVSAAASAAAPTGSGAPGVPTAAACDEINRMTREDMKQLTGASANDWSTFAVNLQSIANTAQDPAFGKALTDLATAALTSSETLASGTPKGQAIDGFLNAVPAVDHLCKVAGVPLS